MHLLGWGKSSVLLCGVQTPPGRHDLHRFLSLIQEAVESCGQGRRKLVRNGHVIWNVFHKHHPEHKRQTHKRHGNLVRLFRSICISLTLLLLTLSPNEHVFSVCLLIRDFM